MVINPTTVATAKRLRALIELKALLASVIADVEVVSGIVHALVPFAAFGMKSFAYIVGVVVVMEFAPGLAFRYGTIGVVRVAPCGFVFFALVVEPIGFCDAFVGIVFAVTIAGVVDALSDTNGLRCRAMGGDRSHSQKGR